METKGQFLSLKRQEEILPYETASRPVVGFSKDYPAGLMADTHAHPNAQLLYAVSGVMHVETQLFSYVIPPSTALLLPAGKQHSIYMEGPVAMRSLFLQGEAAIRICNNAKVVAVSALLRELIISACAEPIEWDLQGRGFYITELALDEVERSSILPFDLPMPTDPRLCRVVKTIRQHPEDNRSLLDWAEVANVSDRTLARLFRHETGLSFRQWRQQARLTAAMSALTNGISPIKAASIAGFNSQPAFGAAFRRGFGITPGQARTLATAFENQSIF